MPTQTRRWNRLAPAALAAGIAALPSLPAHAQITFTPIADSSGVLDSAGMGFPVINNAGEVAFTSLFGGGAGIFRGNGGALTTIAATTAGSPGNLRQFNGIPALSDNGTVAFAAGLDNGGGTGVFRGNGGGLTTIVHSDDGFNTFSQPVISATGAVAFHANISSGGSGIFRGSGGALTTIATTSGFLSSLDDPVMSRNGQVAFRATRDVGSGGGSGIYRGDGGALTRIVDTDDTVPGTASDFGHLQPVTGVTDTGAVAIWGGISNATGIYRGDGGALSTVTDSIGLINVFATTRPSLNEQGQVAFFVRSGDVRGIARSDGSSVDILANSDGPLVNFGAALEINALGTVAFSALRDDGEDAIFASLNGLPAQEVLRTGETLFGSTILELHLQTQGLQQRNFLNDHNQIAFQYRLANGVRGIAVANLGGASAPEPATIALVTLGGGVLALRRRRTR